MEILSDRKFRTAVTLSFFCHALIFLRLPGGFFPVARITVGHDPETVYVSFRPAPAAPEAIVPAAERGAVTVVARTENEPGSAREEMKVKTAAVPAETARKPAAKISPDTALSAGAFFFDYFQAVRSSIRRSIRCPQPMQEGEVCVLFVVSRDGRLYGRPEIIREKSTGGRSLQEAARRGIVEATPFPPFPKEIDSERITFEVPVLFKEEGKIY